MDLSKFNELISIATIADIFGYLVEPFQIYDNGLQKLVFHKDAIQRHNELLESTYLSIKEISNYSSFKKYSAYLLSIVRIKKVEQTYFDQQDYNSMIEYFRSLPLEEVTVWHEILGVILKSKTKITLGSFEIIDWELEKESIQKNLEFDSEYTLQDRKYRYLIGVKVKARDLQKAREVASDYFSAFESIIHLVIGYPNKSMYISILNNDNGIVGQYFAYSKKLGLSEAPKGWTRYLREIEIDDLYFQEREYLLIYKLILNSQRNELQERLYIAAIWLGQAIRSNDIVDGYLKAIISIELLFSTNSNGLISPSIVYQISESIALLLGRDVEECLKIEKEIRDLYGKRSSIVHNGSTSMKRGDYITACEYGRAILFTLLRTKEYRVSNVKEVLEILKRKKYS